MNHHCWVTLYPLSFYYLNHCFPLDSFSDSATKLKALGFTPVWHVGMTVFSCSTLTSIPDFCSPCILPSLLLLCIYFRQPALYNMGLQFSMTINSKKLWMNYGSSWYSGISHQGNCSSDLSSVYNVCSLFGDIYQLCFYKCKLFYWKGRWMVLKIFFFFKSGELSESI